MAVFQRIREDTPMPIRLLKSEIPDWLAALVDKLQAKDPKDRFQSAGEVAELLDLGPV
jgi:eukaryotic-like serine/threonine-protein kinase